MRIAHVVATLQVGGAERFAVDLAAAQRRDGIDAALVAMYGGGPLRDVAVDGGIPTHVITRRVKHDPVAWFRFMRTLKALRPDVVHLHDVAAVMRGAPAARLAGCGAIVAVRHEVRNPGGPRNALLRASARLVDAHVASSQAVARYLTAAGTATTREVIYCGIDSSRFAFREPAPTVAPRLLAIGRLDDQKGHDALVAAAAVLAPRYPNLTLTIAGEGPLRRPLEAQARGLGVLPRVRFTGTVVASEGLLADADIFCFPSRWEAQGLALLEAQASGLPVVASAVDGILETVEHGVTGLLVRPDDAHGLASAIERLVEDHALRLALAREARRRIGRWDVRQSARAFSDVYRAVLSHAPSAVLAVHPPDAAATWRSRP